MIITGNASSQVTVDTQVQGQGSTYTYIETEVNGKKEVFETTEPGKYEIKLEAPSPQPSSEPSPQVEINQSPWQKFLAFLTKCYRML